MKESLISYLGEKPTIKENIFVAPGAKVIGNVSMAKGVSVWYNAVIRADVNTIEIDEYSNIQDNCVVHCDAGKPCKIGKYVTVGHNSIVHGCTINDYALIGMGSIVMDGAEIGEGAVIGAGALVTEGAIIPPYAVAMGVPAKVVKYLDPSSQTECRERAMEYYEFAMGHKQNNR